jgi:hypothetical protein
MRMDDVVQRFRQAVRQELGDRQGAERRYSARLRGQAVAYWRRREPQGDGLSAVATALGIAPMSLRRWADATPFARVQVQGDRAPLPAGVVIIVRADHLRVEGLDVETAAHFVARLR